MQEEHEVPTPPAVTVKAEDSTDMDSQYHHHHQLKQAPIHSDIRIKTLVQPDDVQVKRVGRASCIEPELKVSIESDALYPIGITVNAYLKVLGKDNKHKMILLRKSDEVMMTKVHRRESIPMRLRFLKTIKVQVLKRHLGVARPEASVVFEVVDRHGDVLASEETTHFAIISDPRYLDEVKKRRVGERVEGAESDDDAYHPTMKRTIKRRRTTSAREYEGPVSSISPSGDFAVPEYEGEGSSAEDYTPPGTPLHAAVVPPSPASSPMDTGAAPPSPPIYLTPLQILRNTSDLELYADSEEEYKLIKLVESLKYCGSSQQLFNFQMLPTAAHAS